MFTYCVKHISSFIHRQDNLLDFYTNKKLNCLYRRKLTGLDETSRLAYNSNETKLAITYPLAIDTG